MRTFNNALATTGSAAWRTMIGAMVNWKISPNREEAIRTAKDNSGVDLAGIENSVMAGLQVIADAAAVSVELLLTQEDMTALRNATAKDIVRALDAIHTVWIADNFNAKRWAQKFFAELLFQYRKTAKLPWDQVKLDLFFIEQFLKDAGNQVSEKEIRSAFKTYADENSANDDIPAIAEKASTFAPEIIGYIEAYRNGLNPENKSDEIAKINDFLSSHPNGEDIMEIMIDCL